MINEPIVSSAKIRGIIKKNGIKYVPESSTRFGRIYEGITVWQFASHIMIQPFGYHKPEVIAENLAKFVEALAPYGLTVQRSTTWAYEVVKAGA
jgi:hypothetical protein